MPLCDLHKIILEPKNFFQSKILEEIKIHSTTFKIFLKKLPLYKNQEMTWELLRNLSVNEMRHKYKKLYTFTWPVYLSLTEANFTLIHILIKNSRNIEHVADMVYLSTKDISDYLKKFKFKGEQLNYHLLKASRIGIIPLRLIDNKPIFPDGDPILKEAANEDFEFNLDTLIDKQSLLNDKTQPNPYKEDIAHFDDFFETLVTSNFSPTSLESSATSFLSFQGPPQKSITTNPEQEVQNNEQYHYMNLKPVFFKRPLIDAIDRPVSDKKQKIYNPGKF